MNDRILDLRDPGTWRLLAAVQNYQAKGGKKPKPKGKPVPKGC